MLDGRMWEMWRSEGLPAFCPFHESVRLAWNQGLNAWICPGVHRGECFVYLEDEDVLRALDGGDLRCGCLGVLGSHEITRPEPGCRGMAWTPAVGPIV